MQSNLVNKQGDLPPNPNFYGFFSQDFVAGFWDFFYRAHYSVHTLGFKAFYPQYIPLLPQRAFLLFKLLPCCQEKKPLCIQLINQTVVKTTTDRCMPHGQKS